MSRSPTQAEIEAAKTPNNGWTRDQLAQWGVPWPPPAGWRQNLLRDPALYSRSDDPEAPKWRRAGSYCSRIMDDVVLAIEFRKKCESPIEVMLAVELTRGMYDHPGLLLIPQFPLERFRYDFALKNPEEVKPRILVECDGRDFHSTPEQLANDQRKDDAAAFAGIKLLRFTGADINQEARECARLALTEFCAAGRIQLRA